MADVTKAPVLDTLTRNADGSLRFTWTNHATTSGYYTSIQVLARVVGGGVFTGVNTLGYPAISNRYYNQYTKPGGGAFDPAVGYEMQLRAYGPLGWSAYSNIRSVPATETPTPQFDSITRTGATTARIVMAGVHNLPAKTDTIYAYRRVEGTGSYVQAGSASGSATTMNISGLVSASRYEVYLRAQGPAGWSDITSTKTVSAWAQTPVAPSIIGAERGPATGAVTVAWEGEPTAQAPWRSIEIWLAYGTTEEFRRTATLAGSARTWTGAADPTRAVRVRVIVKSDAGDAQATTSSLSATVLVPNAPSAVTATYLATDRAQVSWTRNPTTERPYTASQRVGWRRFGTDDDWAWTTVASTATQATLQLPPNTLAEFTVDAGNTAGRSELAESFGPLATTPAGPSSLDAQWQGGNIVVTIPAYTTVGDRLVLETSTDNSLWFPAAELPVTARSWMQQSPSPGLPHWYRAQVVSDTPGAPTSPVVTSPPVPALTKPAPPTVLPPTSLDATDAIVVEVVHNPLDGTPQTAGEIRHRVGTGAYSTITLGSLGIGTIPAGTRTNGQTLLVSARTQGAGGEWSDWSEAAAWVLRARPIALPTAPAATVTSQQVAVSWTASVQSSALVELLDASDRVLETRETTGSARSVVFNHRLADRASYTARLTIRDAYQASKPVTRAFTVELDRPGEPGATISFDGDAATTTVVAAVDAGTVLVELWRGEVLVDSAVPVDGYAALLDVLPPLTRLEYTVRAYGTSGGWSESPVLTADACIRDCLLNYGENLTALVRGGKVDRRGSGSGRVSQLVQELDEGVTVYRSEQMEPMSLGVTVQLLPATGASSVDEWLTALRHDGPVVYREPGGRTVRGVATGLSWDDGTRYRAEVSFTITQEA